MNSADPTTASPSYEELLHQAEDLLRADCVDDARALVLRSVDAFPGKDLPARLAYHAGLQLQSERKYKLAAPFFEIAVDLNAPPWSPLALSHLAHIRMRAGRGRGRDLLERLVTLWPETLVGALAARDLAMFASRDGNHDLAVRWRQKSVVLLEQVAELPDPVDHADLEAMQLLINERWRMERNASEAGTWAERLLSLAQERRVRHHVAVARRALIAIEHGIDQREVSCIRRQRKPLPTHEEEPAAKLAMRIGRIAVTQGLAEAERVAHRIIAQHPSTPEAAAAACGLGQTRAYHGDPTVAIQDFQVAIDQGDSHWATEAMIGQAGCYERIGNTRRAIKLLEDALARQSRSLAAVQVISQLIHVDSEGAGYWKRKRLEMLEEIAAHPDAGSNEDLDALLRLFEAAWDYKWPRAADAALRYAGELRERARTRPDGRWHLKWAERALEAIRRGVATREVKWRSIRPTAE